MSDLGALVAELHLVVSRLSRTVDFLSLRVAALELSSQSAESWELVEPEVSFEGGLAVNHRLEEGPPEIPPALLILADVLSSSGGGPGSRAREAFKAGWWAQIALSTHTEYQAVNNSELRFSHWIVLRATGSTAAFRVTRKTDLTKLTQQQPRSSLEIGPVIQGFASLTELRIFCAGAGIGLPPLVRWTNRQ